MDTKKWFIILAGLMFLDAGLTSITISLGGIELNPLWVNVANNFWLLLLIKVIGFAFLYAWIILLERVFSNNFKNRINKRILNSGFSKETLKNKLVGINKIFSMNFKKITYATVSVITSFAVLQNLIIIARLS